MPGNAGIPGDGFRALSDAPGGTELRREQVSIKAVATLELLRDPTTGNLGELLWRIGLPLVALVLALLAIPLSFVNPRASTSVNLMFAVFTYMVYTNLLVGRAGLGAAGPGRRSRSAGGSCTRSMFVVFARVDVYWRINLRLLPRFAR